MRDIQELIAEIAERHHVRVEPDDPIFTVVTVNQHVMEDTVREMLKVMEATLTRFEASVGRAENRAGVILATSVKESSESMRRLIHEDIGAASIKATELVRGVHRAHSGMSLRFWSGVALLCATLLCAASFWLGHLMAVR